VSKTIYTWQLKTLKSLRAAASVINIISN